MNGEAFEEQGVAHLIVWPQPYDDACVQLVTDGAAELPRRAAVNEPAPHRLRAGQRGPSRVPSLDGSGERPAPTRRPVARRTADRRGDAPSGGAARHSTVRCSFRICEGEERAIARDSGYDPPTMADDVAGLIDRLGIERPALIGRLHGGLVAYHLAARRPELVCGVVLGDANPEVTADRASQALADVSSLPRAFASLCGRHSVLRRGFGTPPDRARHDIPSDLEAAPGGGYRWRHDLEIVRRIEAAAIPRSDWDVLARVRCPALILRGQRGEIRQETAERMLAVIPQARAQTIYGSSHDVFLGPGSEQTLAAIQLFLFGLDGGES